MSDGKTQEMIDEAVKKALSKADANVTPIAPAKEPDNQKVTAQLVIDVMDGEIVGVAVEPEGVMSVAAVLSTLEVGRNYVLSKKF